MPNLKFVWEFFGPDSFKLSHHHYLHLKEFLEKENISHSAIGTTFEAENFSFSYVVVDDSLLELIKNSLKPHKAFRE